MINCAQFYLQNVHENESLKRCGETIDFLMVRAFRSGDRPHISPGLGANGPILS